MTRSVDGAKRRAWSERLRRFERCELTLAAFCEAEGVSTPSFYQWRRRQTDPARFAGRSTHAEPAHECEHLSLRPAGRSS